MKGRDKKGREGTRRERNVEEVKGKVEEGKGEVEEGEGRGREGTETRREGKIQEGKEM